ncbi:tetratricopeptide repeat protein [Luteimonas dalianensis]|uniref:tetratricopeptide repeat protein n=1 Tax=Luteimonas dalianensis TaxID=1148196 RepID=UPI003BF135BC
MHEQILDALRRGAHDQAQALARTAIEADPGDTVAYRMLAQALRLGGEHQAALAAIDHAISLAPDDADLHFHRAGVLLGSREVAQARQALEQTLELDPNQLGAYLIQAQIALGSGDLDEAERKAVVAGRIAPEHPVLRSIQAMVALGRGDKAGALAKVSPALEQAPQDVEVLNAAAFIYLANGHLAFAEQAFRRLRELRPGHHALRRALAELLYRQQRFEEALDEIEPMLELPEHASPEGRRFAGHLAMRIGQPERALRWLRGALAAMPADEATLDMAMQAWSRLGDPDDARNALEALLSTSPGVDLLWRARLSVETTPQTRAGVLERWLAARPDSIEAREAQVGRQAAEGDQAGAEATLRGILELAPDHEPAQGRLLDMVAARDPAEAVTFARGLLDKAGADTPRQWALRRWLGRACDLAGDHAGAAQAWSEGQAEAQARHAERLFALPAVTSADAPRADAADVPADAPAMAFLTGLPGSGVDSVARLLDRVVPVFRADRFGPRPPVDPLQRLDLPAALADGVVDAAEVAAQWRQALPARGLAQDGPVIDLLPHWDNILLDVVRPHLPQALLLFALRDPRDMLLDWLSSGGHLPLRMGTPAEAAGWLAAALEHIAVLDEQKLHPHVLLRLDDTINSPPEMAGPVASALGIQLPVPPQGLFGTQRFAAGHWRKYAGVLADAFAVLSPVAVRLGYPKN